MRFEFATATRIIFGPGTLLEAAPLAAGMGSRALVVTGQSLERAQPLLSRLSEQHMEVHTFQVPGEPTTALALGGVRAAREAGCDLVIGLGGGSVLDTGKVIAALLTNSGQLMDYLEIIGRGQPLTRPSAPYIAIPTTAGTGAEVAWNAVLISPEHRVKISMRSPLMMARLAVIDPTLTYSMPPAITASTGLDALTQVMEPFVSLKANPLTDGLCREGMQRAGRSLLRAFEEASDAAIRSRDTTPAMDTRAMDISAQGSREDMALASLFGGLALANAKLGAVHGLAGPLGGMIHAPHGVICARLLPLVMEANVRACTARTPDSPALARYDEVARILTGNPSARAADGILWVKELCAALKVPPLREFGLTEDVFPEAVDKAQRASSMKGNPVTLTAEELTGILRDAL
ncbi:MAG: iron-containing alcohol dehydrogenase [bacterium]